MEIHRWCPTVGIPRKSLFKRVAVLPSITHSHFINTSLFSFPNPFLGQRVTLGEPPAFGTFLIPAWTGGRPISGLSIRFFQLLALKLGFRPHVLVDREGTKYDSKQKKFVKGGKEKGTSNFARKK